MSNNDHNWPQMTETHFAVLEDRGVLRAHGPDMFDLLQRLVTGNLEEVTENRAVYSLLLTPQGKFLFDFFLFADPTQPDAILIDCAASRLADLQRRLTMYKLRADASFDDVSRAFSTVAVWPGTEETVTISNVSFVPDPRGAFLGWRSILPAGEIDGVLSGLQGTQTDAAGYRAFCVSRGVPDGARDIGVDQDFPIETNLDLLNGIDFQKGCFVGQEVASRTHRKGKVRKRLVVAAVDGSLPQPGAEITINGTKVGSVTGHAGKDALALVFLDRVAKSGITVAQAGEAELQLQVPPYADFSLSGDAA